MIGPPNQGHLKSGDTYRIIKSFATLTMKYYSVGELLVLVEPTGQNPWNIIAKDKVNWFVKCKYFSPPVPESIWSGIQYLIETGYLEKQGPP